MRKDFQMPAAQRPYDTPGRKTSMPTSQMPYHKTRRTILTCGMIRALRALTVVILIIAITVGTSKFHSVSGTAFTAVEEALPKIYKAANIPADLDDITFTMETKASFMRDSYPQLQPDHSFVSNSIDSVYTAHQLFDGKISTQWTYKGRQSERLYIAFDEPQVVQAIGLWPGNQKSGEVFIQSNRPKQTYLVLYDGKNALKNDIVLLDKNIEQIAVFSAPVSITAIEFVVGDVYPGYTDKTTVLSDIAIYAPIEDISGSDEADARKDISFPEGTLFWGGHAYAAFCDSSSWEEARDKCTERGGYIASITTEEENNLVYNYFRAHDIWTPYIGLCDFSSTAIKTRNFRWALSGAIPLYTNWNDGEPNSEEERYARFYCNGRWIDDDFSLDEENVYYICEWNLEAK